MRTGVGKWGSQEGAAGAHRGGRNDRETAAARVSSGEEFQRRGRMISGKQKRGNKEGIRGFIDMLTGQQFMPLIVLKRGRDHRAHFQNDEQVMSWVMSPSFLFFSFINSC